MVRWEAEVEAHVPPERLLKFDVRQGWAPLTEFLGVPQPDGAFPHVNDRTLFHAVMAAVAAVGYLIALLVLGSCLSSFDAADGGAWRGTARPSRRRAVCNS